MIPFDEGTSFEEAALAEPLACCYNAYKSVGTLPGDNVLIVGAGPMGVLHMQVNKLAGAGKVMMADVSEPRLKLIEKYGPDVIINTEKEDLKEAVMKNTGGKGADVVITACPAPDIQQQSIELTAKLGRINLFGGLPKGKEHVPLNTNLIHYNGIIVTGTTGASIAHHQAALELITSKQVDTKSLISKRFKLSQIKEAFKYAMSGEGMKTIIEI
jgi:threonine dehydrogenase-like Zn-dependent dehydrogenase